MTLRSRGLAVSLGLVLGLAGWSVATAQTATDYTTYYRYDAMGRVEMKIGPDPDGAGARPRAAEKSVYYDNGRLKQTIVGTTTQIDGSNFTAIQTVTYEYDLAGNKVLETSPAGVTQFGYDGMNRPTCTAVRMDPNTFGGLAAVAPCALASSVSGAYGPDRITENHYDPAGQLERISRGVGTSIQQDWSTTTYTTNGKVKTTADANGNTSTYSYDAFDRLTKLEFPSKARDGTSNALDYEAYGYDDNGNRASLRKRDGLSFTYDYDALNRQTIKHYPGDTTKDVYTHYDLAGRPLSVLFTSGLGVVSTYDAVGRRKTETTHGLVVNSDYDKAGNREWLTWSDGFQVRYGYDNAGLLEKIIEPVSSGLANDQLVGFSYDGLGRRTQATKGNGTLALWSYDGAGRLESLHQGGFASGQTLWQDYVYNPASQITELSQNNLAVVWGGQPNTTTSSSYNGLNQDGAIAILNSDCHDAGAGYDCNGNMLTDGSRHFAYDAENRLVTVKDAQNALKLSITYDPLGRIVETVGSGATTRFVYDGDRLIGEYGGGVFLRRYVHGVGVDEPLVWYQGLDRTDRRWLHADRQGSIVAYSYLGGTTKYYAYGPYGEVQDWADSRFRYTGQIALPEAELFHYKARVYDPKLGRFLQTDPIGYKDDFNLYAYVGNDPLNRNDPTGTQTVPGTMPLTREDAEERQQINRDVATNFVNSVRDDPVGAVITAISIAIDLIDTPISPGPDASIAGGLLNASRKAEDAAGIIYRRIDAANPGAKPYIGRSNSDALFARRQADHSRANPTARYKFEQLERAAPGKPLRQAEQRQIDAHGGPTNGSNPNGGTANKRNEIKTCPTGTRVC